MKNLEKKEDDPEEINRLFKPKNTRIDNLGVYGKDHLWSNENSAFKDFVGKSTSNINLKEERNSSKI